MAEIGDELDARAEATLRRMLEEQAALLAKRDAPSKPKLTKKVRRILRARPPRETRRAKAFQRYRDRKLGKMGAASKVRNIDPATGKEAASGSAIKCPPHPQGLTPA